MSYAQAQNDADNSMPAGDFDVLARCRHCKATFEDHWPCFAHEEDSTASGMSHCGIFWCERQGDGSEFEEIDPDELREAQQERMAEERAGA